MTQLALVILLSLGVSALCSILEAVLLSISGPFVAVLQDRGDKAGELLAKMRQHIDEPISAILTLNTIAHTIGAAVSGAIALELFGDQWLALFSALLTLLILVFSEIIPKTIGARSWRQLARPSAYVLTGMIWIMKPVLIPLQWLNRLLGAKGGRGRISRDELEMMARLGYQQGALREDELRALSNVMALEDVRVEEVMTPRTDIVALPIEGTLQDAKRLFLETGLSKLLVYEDTLDKVMGVVTVQDLLRAESEGNDELRPLLRPVYFVPESKPVSDLLSKLRQSEERVGIVLDEYGGTAGLVTLHDLVEEVVGEIYEQEEGGEEPMIERGGGVWDLAGRLPLRELEKRLDVHLEADVDTVAGYVLHHLGRPARPGDRVEFDGGELEVLETTERRIDWVRLTLGND